MIPTTRDDTRVLEAIPGEVILFARRAGDIWWIGGMTSHERRELRGPLGFLSEGTYSADVYCDDFETAEHELSHLARELDRSALLHITLARAGGFVAQLRSTKR